MFSLWLGNGNQGSSSPPRDLRIPPPQPWHTPVENGQMNVILIHLTSKHVGEERDEQTNRRDYSIQGLV